MTTSADPTGHAPPEHQPSGHQPPGDPLSGNTSNFRAAVRAGDFVFVSGQASVDEAGAIVPGTFAEEMDRSIANVARVLADHGVRFDQIVRVTSYVRDAADLAEYNRRYRDHFAAPLPARTTLTGCLPDTIRFEIDVIAHAPS